MEEQDPDAEIELPDSVDFEEALKATGLPQFSNSRSAPLSSVNAKGKQNLDFSGVNAFEIENFLSDTANDISSFHLDDGDNWGKDSIRNSYGVDPSSVADAGSVKSDVKQVMASVGVSAGAKSKSNATGLGLLQALQTGSKSSQGTEQLPPQQSQSQMSFNGPNGPGGMMGPPGGYSMPPPPNFFMNNGPPNGMMPMPMMGPGGPMPYGMMPGPYGMMPGPYGGPMPPMGMHPGMPMPPMHGGMPPPMMPPMGPGPMLPPLPANFHTLPPAQQMQVLHTAHLAATRGMNGGQGIPPGPRGSRQTEDSQTPSNQQGAISHSNQAPAVVPSETSQKLNKNKGQVKIQETEKIEPMIASDISNHNYTKKLAFIKTNEVSMTGSTEPTPAEAASIRVNNATPVAVTGVDLTTPVTHHDRDVGGRGAGRGGRGAGRGPSRANVNRQNNTNNDSTEKQNGSERKNTRHSNAPSVFPDQKNIGNKINSTQNLRRAPININFNKVKYPHGAMMTSNDVKFVTEKVLSTLRFTDPYAQDFYYLQKGLRTNAILRERAIKENSPMPQMILVPQPLWRDFKVRIQETLASQKEKLLTKTTKWEEDNKVLGHVPRTNVATPKALLSIPKLSNMDNTNAALHDGAPAVEPFTSNLWRMRSQVQRGYEALSTVQELNHLLRSSNISADPFARSEILFEVDRAVANLASSLGIRVSGLTNDSEDISTGEGKRSGPPSGLESRGPTAQTRQIIENTEIGNTTEGSEVELESVQVAVILQSAKGKKLMSRAFTLLDPVHRWALLPAIIARLLQTDPKDQSEEEKEIEAKLLRTLLQFIQHSQQFQMDQQRIMSASYGPGAIASFTTTLIINLRKCLSGIMVAHTEKSALRTSLLSSRSRATLLHQVVTVGDKVRDSIMECMNNTNNTFSIPAAEKGAIVYATEVWVQTREAFMAMLDSATAITK